MHKLKILLMMSFLLITYQAFGQLAPKVDISAIDQLDKKISVDFLNAELKDVLKVFTQQTGVNFIVGQDVMAVKVSMFLDEVTIQEALNSIAIAYHLEFFKVTGTSVYRVKKRIEAEIDFRITKVYKLKYIKVGNLDLADPEVSKPQESESGVATGGKSATDSIQNGLVHALTNVLSENGILTFDDRSNMLIITDYMDRFDRIEKIISALDKRLDQVLIKTEIIELSDSLSNILGVQYGADEGKMFGTNASTSVFSFPWDKGKYTGSSVKKFGVSDYGIADIDELSLGTIKADVFSVVINAIESSAKAKYLSRPRVLTLDCEPAIIDITANTAIQKTSTIDQETDIETDEFEREKTGIMVRVTPHINSNKTYVTMYVEPAVTRAATSEFFPTEALDVHTRKVRTKVRVRSGDTIAIGGLIEKQLVKITRKVPFLGDIPFLGAAFTSKDKQDTESDLLVFITPSIIDEDNIRDLHKKPEDDWTIAEKKKEEEKKSKRWFLGKKQKKKAMDVEKQEHVIKGTLLTDKIRTYEAEALQNPNDPVVRSNLGVAYAKAGRTDAAIEEFKRAILLDPASGAAYNNLGNLYRIKKEYSAAITCLRKSVQLVPDHPYAYTTLGLCYEMRDMFDEAIAAYKNAIKYAPNSDWTNTARERLEALK